MAKPESKKIFASDPLDELLQVQSKHDSQFWLLSYLDVFVLVVMLMVSLISLSEFKQESVPKKHKVTKMKHAPPKVRVKPPLIANSPAPTVMPTSIAVASSPVPTVVPTPIPTIDPQVAFEQQMQAELNEKIKQFGLQESVKLSVNRGFAQFDIQDKVLFQSSAAELSVPGQALLGRLLPLLQDSVGLILIEGHSDNRPIKSGHYPSNWELSAARATTVLHYLTSQELDAERMRAISYADTKPIADNNTKEGREKNRRVNIVIQLDTSSQRINLE